MAEDSDMLKLLKSMHRGEISTSKAAVADTVLPATEMFRIPNLSGDHSAGTTGTPTTDLQIANKKYVDDNVGGTPSDIAYNESTWNANTDAATKNAIRDQVEIMITAEDLNTTHRGLTNNPHSTEMIDDTTPELGGEMDAGAHTIGFTQQSASGDGSTTIDWKLSNKFFFTFGAQNDAFTFTAPSNPCNILLVLKQDSTGSRTTTFPAAVKWPGGTAPTLTTAANSVDIISFYFDGTNYYGVDSLDFS